MTTSNSIGNVPFSWEKKPGVSKTTPTKNCDTRDFSPKLPPPPSPVAEKANVAPLRHLQLPPPPCNFQPRPPHSKCSCRRIFKKRDYDPFYLAYKECTKSPRKGTNNKKNSMSTFSCKNTCSVMENSISIC